MMKKYFSLGGLIKDYRVFHELTQTELADKLDADLRTIQRWEQDRTNIREEKVAELVEKTSLPFQLVRNLNATDPIPTFFDFKTQKYSLTELSTDIPDVDWYKRKMDRTTTRMREMNLEYDFEYLMNYMDIPEEHHFNLRKVIRESIKLLPELNQIITDELGFYAGFSLIVPISIDARELLRNQELRSEQLTTDHVKDYRFLEKPVFFVFNLSADCNDNIQYLVGNMLSFFQKNDHLDYIYCGFGERQDTYHIHDQLGFEEVWRIPDGDYGLRYFEGNFKKFLSN